ncbi:MAG: diphthine--ammonia ligase [Thaumarchaeota archaeon]|nr:diphthine--ammonia ligase [Nitrososphaerota archaeon]
MSSKRAGVLFSGGKDSTYTIAKLRDAGFSISCLITMLSENTSSYMLHTPNIRLTELASQALQIPIVYGNTKGAKEEELEEIKEVVLEAKQKYGLEALASGGIASKYQKDRLSLIAEKTGLDSVNPLWGIDQKKYVSQIVNEGYRFIITSVSAAGLDEEWLGREIDHQSVKKLICISEKFGFNASLEGGEGETLVVDCPIYIHTRLKIVSAEKIWDGYRGLLKIEKAELVPKEETWS